MNNKVLIVDDDVNLLASLRRRLSRRFTVTTAVSAEEGLTALKQHGPAVVVSDQRKDHMNGRQFLAEVKDRAPDTMRMILTSNVDLRVAIDAINEAGAFRFLTKPCRGEDLIDAVEKGIKQYWLNTVERYAA